MNEAEENYSETLNKADDRLINNYMPFIKNILVERKRNRIFATV
ncbi:hypothetical protein [Emticicia sp. C21]|nr:hypothetical protein [Emticicia sp. C21]